MISYKFCPTSECQVLKIRGSMWLAFSYMVNFPIQSYICNGGFNIFLDTAIKLNGTDNRI